MTISDKLRNACRWVKKHVKLVFLLIVSLLTASVVPVVFNPANIPTGQGETRYFANQTWQTGLYNLSNTQTANNNSVLIDSVYDATWALTMGVNISVVDTDNILRNVTNGVQVIGSRSISTTTGDWAVQVNWTHATIDQSGIGIQVDWFADNNDYLGGSGIPVTKRFSFRTENQSFIDIPAGVWTFNYTGRTKYTSSTKMRDGYICYGKARYNTNIANYNVTYGTPTPDLLTYTSTVDTRDTNLGYASVYDGYLWLVYSDEASPSKRQLVKLDAADFSVLGNRTSTHPWYQCYSAYVHNGVVYVPGGVNSFALGNGMIETFNESTLEPINFYKDTYFPGQNLFVQAIYSPENDKMLFSADMQNSSLGIYSVDPDEVAVNASYHYIPIATNPVGTPSEGLMTIYNGTVYVEFACFGGTPFRTRLYSSTDLVTWTFLWEKNMTNTGGGYFGGITSNTHWLATGYITNQTTGVTTYRIGYYNGSWYEYDTGLPETENEDHPVVNMLTDNELLFEYSQAGVSHDHSLYIFNLADGTLDFLSNMTDHGYNDRIIMNYGTSFFLNNEDMYHTGKSAIYEYTLNVATYLTVGWNSFAPYTIDVGHTLAEVNASLIADGVSWTAIVLEYVNGTRYTFIYGMDVDAYVPVASTNDTFYVYCDVAGNWSHEYG